MNDYVAEGVHKMTASHFDEMKVLAKSLKIMIECSFYHV